MRRRAWHRSKLPYPIQCCHVLSLPSRTQRKYGSSRQWSSATSITSSAKRIQKELSEISVDPPCNCFAGPKGDNLHEWISTILGPSDDPLVGTIARQYLTDRSGHDKTVAEWTRRFAH